MAVTPRQTLSHYRQEVRLLASLNHPNTAAIHGLEEPDGIRYLVLELVPGQTLAERIARGPLTVIGNPLLGEGCDATT